MARLSLSLLEPFRATLDGKPVAGFESNNVRALLAYLAIESDHPHTREALAGLLWPDQSDQVARSNLRQALANLRQAIGDEAAHPPFLHITRESIQFNVEAEHWLDVTAFTALLATSEKHLHRRAETCKHCAQWLQQAVELYCGNFLEYFFVSDSAAFEEWALVKREGLRRLALNALYHLADFHERRGAYEQAHRYAARQLELDPWREEAHQQAMRALASSGQRTAALAQYETCRRVLDEELGAEPTDETQALYEQIKNVGTLELSNISTFQLSNLPIQTTSFIGRETELIEIAELLASPSCQLVTLTGPGGIGKTRLALQAAVEQIGSFADGVYFIPLAALNSVEFLAPTIAEAMNFTFSSQGDPKEQLANHLRHKEILLVLDNFEHLLPTSPFFSSFNDAGDGSEGIRLLVNILIQAPGVVLLVTSRERLNLQAEWVFDLQGLSFPKGEKTEEIEQYSAVQLFVERARQVQRQFALTGREASGVVRICQLVEGMPLAVEIAAAAVHTRSCTAIASEIERGVQALATTLRDVSEQHRSMWAVFEHSWRLLSQEEQQVFCQLSVFRGGFQGEAAASVAAATLPVLPALVDKSLLRLDPTGRYDMHKLIRQHAGEKLAEASEVEPTRNRHLMYFLAIAEQAFENLYTAQQQEWLARLESDHDNLRAALGWALENRNVELSARLGGALTRFWGLHGYLSEGRRWVEQVMTLFQPVLPTAAVRAKVLLGAGMLAWRQNEFNQAITLMEESLAISRESRDAPEISRGLQSLATVESTRGNTTRAAALLEECLARDRENGNREGVAYDLGTLADIAYQQGNSTQARNYYEESLALHRERDDKNSIAICLNNLGEVARLQGDYLKSVALFEEALSLFRELGVKQSLAICLASLGELRLRSGDYERARVLYREALTLQHEVDATGDMVSTLPAFAASALKTGNLERATRLYAAAEALRAVVEVPISGAQSAEYKANIAVARDRLGELAFETTWAEGRAMTIEQAITYALTE